ncbi:rhodanese-like domain-containing protein [Litorisediminicola beolgyonensis]|uniref:Rhodanese-like domain-containing protein n=1 Tax=Litorisediminicola beolgyonensis TaxID=1173614 RepID=A0ABW3ZNP8_9RHOB
MSRLKITAAEMVAEARSQIPELTAAEALPLADDPDTVIVDIRDIRERAKTGWIPGSVHAPRGMLEFWVDPESPYHKPVFAQPGKTYVFHCASGWRSALAVFQLQKMGFEASHISDGFTGWVAAGGPVTDEETGR